jgi:hypothetical protein
MLDQTIKIVAVFSSDDQLWMRRTAVEVPKFWKDHSIAPALGDVLRLGGRQFVIQARVWEHDGGMPMLRLFLGNGHAHSDTVFGSD